MNRKVLLCFIMIIFNLSLNFLSCSLITYEFLEALPAVDDNVDDEEPVEAEAEEKPQLDENKTSKNRTEYILHLIEVFVQAVPDGRPPDTVNEAESNSVQQSFGKSSKIQNFSLL